MEGHYKTPDTVIQQQENPSTGSEKPRKFTQFKENK